VRSTRTYAGPNRPASQINRTNWFVTSDGGRRGFSGEGYEDAYYALAGQWTDQLPK
jgi:hypothetical protein